MTYICKSFAFGLKVRFSVEIKEQLDHKFCYWNSLESIIFHHIIVSIVKVLYIANISTVLKPFLFNIICVYVDSVSITKE